MPASKQCYQCGNDNPDQAFCGSCGSPLAFNDYISKHVKDQLSDAIQDRDVLERDSAIKVFQQAWGWIKLIIGVAAGLLVFTGVGVFWTASDFRSGVDEAKKSVTASAKHSSDDIARASKDAVQQSQTLKTTILKTQADVSGQTASLRRDIEGSRKELEAASRFEPEMENLRTQLAKANSEIQAQQKALSSSQEFVKSIFAGRVTEYFSFKLNAGGTRTVDLKNHYAVIPPTAKDDRITTVLMLLKATPIDGTLQLQQRVAVQPQGSYVSVHNLVVFAWGDAPAGLEQQPLGVSYLADKNDAEIIKSLSEHDGRVFADDQPLPKYGEPDPGFKGNKWVPVPQGPAKP